MFTIEDWAVIATKTLITQQRALSDRLNSRADLFEKEGLCILGQSAASIRADATIARWESDTLEREGKLPDDYMALLD